MLDSARGVIILTRCCYGVFRSLGTFGPARACKPSVGKGRNPKSTKRRNYSEVPTALSVAREKELGTFDQLLVSPLRAGEILVGKAVPAVALGGLEGTLMITMAVLVFRLPLSWHGLQVLLAAMPLFLIAVVGIGLFVSSLARTQQQGLLGAFTYQVPATLLSGFATPVENIALGLRWIAYVNPLQYMVSLARMAFLEDPGWDVVLGLIWPMVPIGLVSLTAAALLFRQATLLAAAGK
jgi:ABC-2 type transport system permease protein